jgi:hypothetical protein
MLFIGFGLRDPNFKSIYRDARSFYDVTKREAYALMSGVNSVERGLWENEGLLVLPFKNDAELPTVLNNLSDELQRRSA